MLVSSEILHVTLKKWSSEILHFAQKKVMRTAVAEAVIALNAPLEGLHSLPLLRILEGVHRALGHSMNVGSEPRGLVVGQRHHIDLRRLAEMLRNGWLLSVVAIVPHDAHRRELLIVAAVTFEALKIG